MFLYIVLDTFYSFLFFALMQMFQSLNFISLCMFSIFYIVYLIPVLCILLIVGTSLSSLTVTFPCVCAKCLVCFYCVAYFYLNTYLLEFFEGWVKSCIPLCWIYVACSMLLKFLKNTPNLRNPLKRISHFRVHDQCKLTSYNNEKADSAFRCSGRFFFSFTIVHSCSKVPCSGKFIPLVKGCSSNHHRG